MPVTSCHCKVVGNFHPELKHLNLISVETRASAQILVTSNECVLRGPVVGQLNIRAYGRFTPNPNVPYKCPGRAGLSANWMQKYDCYHNALHFIRNGVDRSFTEGEIDSGIKITCVSHTTGYSVSAGNGPVSPYIESDRCDGYNLSYSGPPFGISGSAKTSVSLPFVGGPLYLNSFSWEQAPPSMPVVSYNYLYSIS